MPSALGSTGAPSGTNWGNRATKNTASFGLARLVMSPCRSAVPGGGGSASARRPSRPCSPSTIRTIAPISLIVVNSDAEAATTAATPTAANTAQARIPTELPTVTSSASRRPPRTALRTTSAVATPGVIVRSAATGRKARKVLSSGELVVDPQRRGARLGGRGGLGRRVARRLDAHHLGELAGLVHLGDDVAAADQLALHEQLGDRRPVGDRRQLLADARVGQDVDGRVLGAERLERSRRARGEAAHGPLGRALHEEDDLVVTDGALDGVADGVLGHGCHSALVSRERAWVGPPMSAPNTA